MTWAGLPRYSRMRCSEVLVGRQSGRPARRGTSPRGPAGPRTPVAAPMGQYESPRTKDPHRRIPPATASDPDQATVTACGHASPAGVARTIETTRPAQGPHPRPSTGVAWAHHVKMLSMSQGRAAWMVTNPPDGPTLSPGADQLDTIIEIATWFYVHGWSQVRIATALDLDPSTVSRYLKRARDESIVRIEIRRPPRPTESLARDVADRLGLGRVVVVPVGDDPLGQCRGRRRRASQRSPAGSLPARRLLGQHAGRGGSPSASGSVDRLTIAQLAGGLEDSGPGIQGHELVRSLGVVFPASRLRYLHAPAIVDSPPSAMPSSATAASATRSGSRPRARWRSSASAPWMTMRRSSGADTSPMPTGAGWCTRAPSAT